MSGYTKLFASLIHSTVWREPDYVRLVWITMLAIADRDGVVEAAVPGLADAARVSLQDCLSALERLKAPDEYSRTREHEGRRIEETDGGWVILNHAKYREQMTLEQLRAKQSERQRRYRERLKQRSAVAHGEDTPPDHDGSPDETVCPMDIVARAEKLYPDMLAHMPGVTTEQLRDKTREFLSYWTIGGGKFKRRRFWMRKLREDLRLAFEKKRLRAPGEIEHDDRKPKPVPMSDGAAKLIAMAKEEDAKRRPRKAAAE